MTINNSLLDKLYANLASHKTCTAKAQALTTIIEYKQNNHNLYYYRSSLYLDTKMMLSHYIKSRNSKDYGYDQLDCDFISEYIEQPYLSNRQQLALYKKASSELVAIGEDSDWIKKRELDIKLNIFKHENILKYIIVLSGKSKRNCLWTLLILFVIECISLMPVANKKFALFVLNEVHYCDNEIFNYIVNVLALRLDWINGPELSCLSWVGVFLIFIWLIIYFVFVANILFKNLFGNIDIYEISE